MAIALLLATATPASAGGPKLIEPIGDRIDALACSGDLAESAGVPVLLVHGTGLTPEENWSFGFRRELIDRGHSVCTVRLPGRGYGDAQRSLEYVVTAIRSMNSRAGRKVSVVGHSQGAVLPPIAFRIWPGLAAKIEDFVGLGGLYEPAINCHCRGGCPPAFWQIAKRSSGFWAAVVGHVLPDTTSYTAIGTRHDEIVKPQPQANRLPPGPDRRSVLIQDICPGRGSAAGYHHVYLAADAIAFALTIDALDHPGPAAPARISRHLCLSQFHQGFDAVGFARVAPKLMTIPPGRAASGEPPLRCLLDPDCLDETWTVPLLESASLGKAEIGSGTRLRIEAGGAGLLKVRLQRLSRGGERRIGPARQARLVSGTRAIRIRPRWCTRNGTERRCRRLAPGRYRLDLLTKVSTAGFWTRERALDMQV